MATYLIRRLLQGIIVLLAVSMVCFVMFRYTGDPVLMLAGKYATQEEREQVRVAYGLDRPVYVQYLSFLGGAVQGDFGKSYVSQISALRMILERFPATFELALVAISISFVLGVGLGVVVSIKPRGWLSRIIMAGSLFGISIPTFLIGILLVMAFSVYLGLMPSFGRGDTVQIGFWRTGLLTASGWYHIILPALTLSGYQLAVLIRLTRAGMRETLSEEYIKTAWAKGLAPHTVVLKHALRNVMIPIVTITGLSFGELIAFSIVTETIFQWPGMGNLLLTSIFETDHPVVVTYIMLAAFIILTINILVDVLYAFLNPRIRFD
ncbi:MAG: ABC transporter permease [Desulfofustis sp. PB-SRB1]|jgi:ABC-type dipeptide/oligopeptide/nickel transport system permease component|nr:ABC transporter permease [Desulfofustis sp. PB-SRB1]MBM1002259.1 ABC transporter permease [Desulfofustis sp. PB-SRB1]HBH29455.1 ABC transporter permease [Desulfofustis sp.]HBH31584.1 ABC transporter permease [Desulfofustis sp.]